MKRIWAFATALALAGAAPAAAQGYLPISLEGRIDAGLPVGDGSDAYDTATGFGLSAALELSPTLAVYGGWSTFAFPVGGDDVNVSGGEFGGRLLVGTGGGVWTPFVQLGALFHEDGTGLEAGLGALYPVAQNLAVTPMVRYRTIQDFDYVTLGVGLNVRL